MRITKTTVDNLEFVPDRSNQQLYWDDDQPGFGIRITQTAKTYIVESRVNGKTRRVSLGRHGKLTAEQARKLAKKEIGKLASGIDPAVQKVERRQRGITLQQAFENYIAGKTAKGGKSEDGLKPLTVRDYRKAMDESFADWMNQPILTITVEKVRRRYQKRVNESPARANNAFRVLRAVLRDAAMELQDKAAKADLQAVVRDALHKRWAKIDRRETVIGKDDLPRWVRAVVDLRNDHPQAKADVVSDYLMFCILTGCRREEAATLRWANVDFKSMTFTLRDTKNREDHTLPMTDWLIEMFSRRRWEKDGDFVFPGEGRTGHLVEPRKQMLRVTKSCGVKFSVHDLRRSFAVIAEGLGVGQYTLKRLMNHKMTDDVTAGYVVLKVENLREPMQRITDYVCRAGGVKPGGELVEFPGRSSAAVGHQA